MTLAMTCRRCNAPFTISSLDTNFRDSRKSSLLGCFGGDFVGRRDALVADLRIAGFDVDDQIPYRAQRTLAGAAAGVVRIHYQRDLRRIPHEICEGPLEGCFADALPGTGFPLGG